MLALRHATERHPRGDHLRELRLRQHLLTVAPRIVGDEAPDMLEQVAHADARTVLGRIGPALHLGHILLGEVVEAQLALVAKLEDRERGERLRHRGDTEQAVGRDRALVLELLNPDALHISEFAIPDDPIDQPRHMLIGLKFGKKRVDFGGDLVEGSGSGILCQRGERRRQRDRHHQHHIVAHAALPAVRAEASRAKRDDNRTT